ncbi:hypothetical protein DQM68_06030 [Leptospira mayottensis]|uniref:Uncharacterized protein n=1 Tax=Leptospira mayottensis TaxID=1137606 RepID=A0ABM6YAP2_9LEPT|nr:hypothetical protein DQM68_06030 [Leptospira mayottensis]AXR64130.1 hypothetical protein DQM28_07740 [Leptospira mayottensis]AZQ03256.1 hypothetical protein LEP1GSC190_15660 [Leptospira mayottensis 200901116]TGN00403.1 hypothetical protein EHR03_12890 [Leptospira mayottensis]
MKYWRRIPRSNEPIFNHFRRAIEDRFVLKKVIYTGFLTLPRFRICHLHSSTDTSLSSTLKNSIFFQVFFGESCNF